MGHDVLAGLTAFALCLAWFTLGDVLFPEITLGKVAFTLVPAVVFGSLALREASK